MSLPKWRREIEDIKIKDRDALLTPYQLGRAMWEKIHKEGFESREGFATHYDLSDDVTERVSCEWVPPPNWSWESVLRVLGYRRVVFYMKDGKGLVLKRKKTKVGEVPDSLASTPTLD